MAPGDLVMVHASLRRLGLARTDFGEGGAELLLDVLDEAVGRSGTLLMTRGTAYALDWVNRQPVEQRADLLRETEGLDFRSALAMPDVGWLAEAFRTRQGTIVSDNPSGRFDARGAAAKALLADPPLARLLRPWIAAAQIVR